MSKGSPLPPVQVFRMSEKAICPTRGHETDAGFDISVVGVKQDTQRTDFPIVFHTHLVIVFNDPTLYGEIYARSSLARKHGFTLSNGVGIIDPSYRGELLISVHVEQHRAIAFRIGFPERIAQLLIKQRTFLGTLALEQGLWSEHVDKEEYKTERANGAFGSTD